MKNLHAWLTAACGIDLRVATEWNNILQCGIFSAAGGVKTCISVTETCDVVFKLSPQ